MRDLNECRDEIFKRGEERIKARRKKVRRTLMCCVPLCLTVAVLCALLPVFLNGGGAPAANGSDGFTEDGAENEVGAEYTELYGASQSASEGLYTDAEIRIVDKADEYVQKITDKEAVTEILEIIVSAYIDRDPESDVTDYQSAYENEGIFVLPDVINISSVAFKAEDGSGITYRMVGYTLINESGQQAVLSDAELERLHEILNEENEKQ
ncbi:MAG: hypothetical protein ACI4SJ_06045 [Candidatus Avispirillum sp.]